MDNSTITSSTFTVIDNSSNSVSGTISTSDNATSNTTTVTFTPSSAFEQKTYTATLSTNVKDLDANALASNYSWNYNIVNTQGYFAAGPDPFYSKDGSTWVEVESTSSPNSGWHNYVGYGNKMFVIVHRQSSPYIYYTTDARTWTAANLTVQGGAACNNLNSVEYANSIWVAVGEDEHAWSSDGINWTCKDVGDGNNQMAVAYGNGKFISIPSSGSNTGETGKYSTDGENWTTFSVSNLSVSSNLPMGG